MCARAHTGNERDVAAVFADHVAAVFHERAIHRRLLLLHVGELDDRFAALLLQLLEVLLQTLQLAACRRALCCSIGIGIGVGVITHYGVAHELRERHTIGGVGLSGEETGRTVFDVLVLRAVLAEIAHAVELELRQ